MLIWYASILSYVILATEKMPIVRLSYKNALFSLINYIFSLLFHIRRACISENSGNSLWIIPFPKLQNQRKCSIFVIFFLLHFPSFCVLCNSEFIWKYISFSLQSYCILLWQKMSNAFRRNRELFKIVSEIILLTFE